MAVKRYGTLLIESYSYLLFSQSKLVGVLLFLLSFINPSVGYHGLVAFCGALLFAHLSHPQGERIPQTLLLYNSLLSGLAVGYLYEITLLSTLFVAIGGVLTFLISSAIQNLFYRISTLPILNLPFALIATILYLAALQYGSLFHSNTTPMVEWLSLPMLPAALQGLFRALGILIFLPYDIVGLILLVAILFYSRINFLLVIVAYFAGTFFHGLLSGVPSSGWSDPYSFNYILIALALGGYYLIPSKRTYSITLAAIAVSTILLDAVSVFWANFGIPVFTFPFALTVLLFLYALWGFRYPYLTRHFRKSPEENLEQWCNVSSRFMNFLPAPRLPFNGMWEVYQGFSDTWTHKGVWQYAVDFVITDSEHKTYHGSGLRPRDYYCFDKPVLSPVTGVVVSLESSIEDNSIGEVDKSNNWGNYIIIYTDFGYYVELSHLKKESLSVAVGESVVAGQIIGRCGNSGYSPEPHIHMQVQYSNYIGAPTTPFTFSQAVAEGELVKEGYVPQKGDQLTPLVVSLRLQRLLQFIIDDTLSFQLRKDGVDLGLVTIIVGLDSDGSYYFEDTFYKSRLYFQQSDSAFTLTSFLGSPQSPLRFFFIALASLPLSEKRIVWKDYIPGSLLQRRVPFYSSLFKSFRHSLYSAIGEYTIDGNSITGSIRYTKLIGYDRITTKVIMKEQGCFEKIEVVFDSGTHEGEHYVLTAR